MKHLLPYPFVLLILLISNNSHAEPYEVPLFMAQVESLEMAEQFDQLEKMAQDLRQTDARFIGSNSKLRSFYSALGAMKPCACDKAFNESHSFDEKAAILNKWLTAKPTSMVAKIAMTNLYYYYAWQARGTGYANTVTPEAWQLFRERLKQAWTYIRDLDPKLDPVIFDERIGILRDVNSQRKTMDAVDDAATKSFPRYFHFYADRAELLQQKWLGGAGELENYTQSLLDNPGGEDGQIAYTYAASRLSFQYSREDIFSKTGLVWSQVKNAYAARQKLYGLNNHDWNVFLELAVSGNDKPAAIEALSHIGNDWDKAVWRDKSLFDSVVIWVTQQ